MPGTPIPMGRQTHRAHSASGFYTPHVSKLKTNYDREFQKFLRSAKTAIDHLDKIEMQILCPLKKKIKRFHKESNTLDVYFRSQTYWRSFYKELMNRSDDVMDCFRFEDLRDVAAVVESHRLPDVLVSFVTQQLMEWRELFKDVEWMRKFRELSHNMDSLKTKRIEHVLRQDIIREIGVAIDVHNLKIDDFRSHSNNTERVAEGIAHAIEESKNKQDAGNQLKHVPVLSKQMSVRRWYREHYGDPQALSDESDEESLSDGDNSSLFVGTADSSSRDASDISTEEVVTENEFDEFFN